MEQNPLQEPIFQPTYLNLEYFFEKIASFFGNFQGLFSGEGIGGAALESYRSLEVIASLLGILLLTVIIFSLVRTVEIYRYQKRRLQMTVARAHEERSDVASGTPNTERWNRIVDRITSDNQSDWKVAIMEADAMLDELLVEQGFPGENLGERLMNAELGDFLTLNQAWEAHKVRNRIAHSAEEEAHLTDREVQRVIRLYQQVFEEFDWI